MHNVKIHTITKKDTEEQTFNQFNLDFKENQTGILEYKPNQLGKLNDSINKFYDNFPYFTYFTYLGESFNLEASTEESKYIFNVNELNLVTKDDKIVTYINNQYYEANITNITNNQITIDKTLDIPKHNIIYYYKKTSNSFKIRVSNKERILRTNYSSIEYTGILRYNNLENNNFELYNNSFVLLTGNNKGNTGISNFKRLKFNDKYNSFNNNLNKGINKIFNGNIFRDISVKENSTNLNSYIDYNSDLIYSTPVFKYDDNNLFNLNNHYIKFRKNDSNSYKVYVRENDNFIKNFTFVTNITDNIKNDGYYKFNFKNNFTFYNSNYSNMSINKSGYISFTNEGKLERKNYVSKLNIDNFTYGKSEITEPMPNINEYFSCETKIIKGNGSGLKIKFKYIEYQIGKYQIDKNTIRIIYGGSNYKEGDILSLDISESNDNIIIVEEVSSDIFKSSYKNLLKGYNINFFRGELEFNYLSKVYISEVDEDEIVITFLNLSYVNSYSLINIQIRLWCNNKVITSSTFSDENYLNGDIEISYKISNRKNVNNDTFLGNKFDNLFIGITNNIKYDDNFNPLNFYSLIDDKYSFSRSRGVPKLDARIIFDKSYNQQEKFDINNDNWNSSYVEDDNNIKYYIKIFDLGSDDGNLPTKFNAAVSSEFDYKIIKEYTGIDSGYFYNIEKKYYSDMTVEDLDDFILVKNISIDNMKPLIVDTPIELTGLVNLYKYNSFYDKKTFELYDTMLNNVEFKYQNVLKEVNIYETTNDLEQYIYSIDNIQKNLFVKFYYRLNSDLYNNNTSFTNAIKISSDKSNIHIKKNESIYFQIVGSDPIPTSIELRYMNRWSGSNKGENIPLVGLSLELYDSDENIKLYSNTIIEDSSGHESIKIENTTAINLEEEDYIIIISENDNKFLEIIF
uniref:Uncharacterized protein n=1 Tax=Mimiviridae sp. ChoanoV1 TaxID=2596887 RepID=A0A5B8IEP9_9VIRU|nr:hypothetical protein 1_113 [Mimiviridae sp. ChoanoV1]